MDSYNIIFLLKSEKKLLLGKYFATKRLLKTQCSKSSVILLNNRELILFQSVDRLKRRIKNRLSTVLNLKETDLDDLVRCIMTHPEVDSCFVTNDVIVYYKTLFQ